MLSPPHATDAVDRAVADGRKLVRLQLMARAAGWAVAVALLGPLLLLLFGSTWFPPALLWVGLIGGIATATAIWRKAQTSDYEIAQALDRSWECADQVSTACYFGSEADASSDEIRAQREMAARASDGRVAGEALALKTPVAAWCAAAVLLAVASLVGVRYSVAPQLALESSLPPLLFPGWAGESSEELAAALITDRADDEADGDRNATRSDEHLAEARDAAGPTPLNIDPVAALGEDGASAAPEVEGLDAQADAGDQLSFEDPGSRDDQGPAGDEGSPDEQGSNLDRQAESMERQDADGDWGQQSNSLLDRLKEALKQLSEGRDPESPQTAQQDPGSQQEGSNAENSPEASEEGSAEAANGQGAPAEAAMEADESESENPMQAAQGGGDYSGSGNEGEGQSEGAAGDGEGTKEIEKRLAQQAAFEALEEFYLQRAEELSGDVLVETTTGEASAAATPYRLQQGSHRDNSGLALRDEAPAAYRTFVENYFREIRLKEE